MTYRAEDRQYRGTHVGVMGMDFEPGPAIVDHLRSLDYRVTILPGPADVAGISDPLEAIVCNLSAPREEVSFSDITDEQFQSVLEREFFAPAEAAQAAARLMTNGGSIVFVIDARAQLGAGGAAHVAATATALVALCRSMAIELRALGIRVNVVGSELAATSRQDAESICKRIAATVAFLVHRDGSLISGEALLLDRGESLNVARKTKPSDSR